MNERNKSHFGKWACAGYCIPVVLMATLVATSGVVAATATPQQELTNTLTNVRNLLVALGTIVAAIGYIVTAYMWMTSTGNPETRSKARKYFMDVTFGIFLLFISSFLVQLAQSLVV